MIAEQPFYEPNFDITSPGAELGITKHLLWEIKMTFFQKDTENV